MSTKATSGGAVVDAPPRTGSGAAAGADGGRRSQTTSAATQPSATTATAANLKREFRLVEPAGAFQIPNSEFQILTAASRSRSTAPRDWPLDSRRDGRQPR